MQETTISRSSVVTIAGQSRRYTDAQVEVLKSQITAIRSEVYHERVRGAKYRARNHLICLAIGLAVACALIWLGTGGYLSVLLGGVPSAAMELVDRALTL